MVTKARTGVRIHLARAAGAVCQWARGSRPSLWTKAAAELTGCMIFHFLGSVSPTASTNSVALMVLVYYTAKLSGAHLNPALTATFALLGYTNPVEVLVYWMAQVLGSVLGAMWISALVPGLAIGGDVGSHADVAGCFRAAPGITDANVFGWEAVGTFCFILPIFSVVWYTQSKSGYGNTGPIIVGLSLYAAASAVGPFTGAALNPARVVASAIVFKCPGGSSLWSYVAGELAGAVVVPIAVIPWYGVSSALASLALDREEEDMGSGGAAADVEEDGGSKENKSKDDDDEEFGRQLFQYSQAGASVVSVAASHPICLSSVRVDEVGCSSPAHSRPIPIVQQQQQQQQPFARRSLAAHADPLSSTLHSLQLPKMARYHYAAPAAPSPLPPWEELMTTTPADRTSGHAVVLDDPDSIAYQCTPLRHVRVRTSMMKQAQQNQQQQQQQQQQRNQQQQAERTSGGASA